MNQVKKLVHMVTLLHFQISLCYCNRLCSIITTQTKSSRPQSDIHVSDAIVRPWEKNPVGGSILVISHLTNQKPAVSVPVLSEVPRLLLLSLSALTFKSVTTRACNIGKQCNNQHYLTRLKNVMFSRCGQHRSLWPTARSLQLKWNYQRKRLRLRPGLARLAVQPIRFTASTTCNSWIPERLFAYLVRQHYQRKRRGTTVPYVCRRAGGCKAFAFWRLFWCFPKIWYIVYEARHMCYTRHTLHIIYFK